MNALRLIRCSPLLVILTWPSVGAAQDPPPVHEHVAVTAPVLTPTKEASGTAWLPAVTPMYGAHRPWRGWDLRMTGVLFAQALFEPRDRHRTGGFSTRQATFPNWGMFMARRTVAGGRFGVRTMLSVEPLTVRDCGSLSFLAVGEVCDDDTVHDRRPPHDLFMELAVDYERSFSPGWRWQLYAGLAGEPALGPPGYPHRASATANPLAPITHHWLDATHVTFGVVTVAVHNQQWKAEVSAFNGRDPDASRVDVDLGSLDSFAARATFLPTERFAIQFSVGRLRDATTEFPFPGQEPIIRFTASAAYHHPLAANGIWATTVAYGSNYAQTGAGDMLHTPTDGLVYARTGGMLLESRLTVADRHTVFGRGEAAGMPAHHLHALEYPMFVFNIGKAQLGYVWHLRPVKGVQAGFGASAAISFVPPELESRYEGRTAPSFGVFFNLQGARHQM
jgi:hypothetical protein